MFSKVTKSHIRMSSSDDKYSSKYWLKALKFTDDSVAKSELVDIVFRIFTPGVGLDRMNQGQTISNEVYKNRRTNLLQIRAKTLRIYNIESINDLGVTPEAQLLILHKSTLV